ncbi:hypothetical protein HOA59_02575 [archaeon]|jgi:hypothetical protein|nr:hypothetical protein [archaeon]MBT6824297.1 hypothetical protein [archaeon]MBT7107375.1 hypothetical protein [archaeon]MBT7297341.1 hypothetical protein [archaeon]
MLYEKLFLYSEDGPKIGINRDLPRLKFDHHFKNVEIEPIKPIVIEPFKAPIEYEPVNPIELEPSKPFEVEPVIPEYQPFKE